jgi:hypothetical protein
MFRTSKSKLAHSTVVAGTLSLLLSSSALAGFHVGGGVRATSFVRAPAMAPLTAAIHPSFDRGSVLRTTNSSVSDRFVGARAVYRPPFPSNSIAGLASHPQGNLPAGVATLNGAPYGISSSWHTPSVGLSAGGTPAASPGIAAYGVTVGTPPAGKTAGQSGSASLGTVQTGAATSGNAQASTVAGLLQPYNGSAAIGSVQLGAGTSGNAQIGARGGLAPYNGPGAAAIGNVQLGTATRGTLPTGVATLRTWPSGQGPNQPGLGTSQAGSGSGTGVTLPAGVWALDQEVAKAKEALKLDNELTAAMTQFQNDVNCYNEELQYMQAALQQLVQQLESCSALGCDAAMLGDQIQMVSAEIKAYQSALLGLIDTAETDFANTVPAGWFFYGYSGPSDAEAWINANPGLGSAIGAAGVQDIINQLSQTSNSLNACYFYY